MKLAHAFAVLVTAALAAFARADEPTPPAVEKPDDWAAVPVVTLRDASSDGSVVASGSEPQGYQAVKLHLKNTTDRRVAVDLAGSYLVPRSRGSCQRLALGPPITPGSTVRRGEGTLVVQLAPGDETSFFVNTCCMDAGLASPSKQSFETAKSAMPPVREKVMRWWAEHPSAPQGSVNCAIWTNSPEVQVTPGVVKNFEKPEGRFAVAHGGVYFALVDGVLTSVDADGVVRILGSEIFQALPTDDAIYAVMLGEDRKPKLWRLAMTGDERWGRVMDLEDTNRIHEVITPGKDRIVLVTDKGVDVHDLAKDTTTRVLDGEQSSFLSARRASEGRLSISLRRPPKPGTFQGGETRNATSPVSELWSLDLASCEVRQEERYWNVEMMLAGPAGVFALSRTEGKLRRLAGERFTDLGAYTSYSRLLAVSSDILWLADEGGRVVAAEAKSGKVRFRTELVAGGDLAFSVDAKTGDLVYVRGEEFRRIGAEGGADAGVATR